MKHHRVEDIRFSKTALMLRIDGEEHSYQLTEISPKLAHAGDAERMKFEISPSGYGIHWPLLDEDISIDGMLGIRHFPRKRSAA